MTLVSRIEVMRADDLGDELRAQVIHLCSAAFKEDFTSLFRLLPGSTHVLAYHDERLVGHACWVTRWLQPADLGPLRTAYVEAVAVDPGWQRRGIGTAVMTRLAKEILEYPLGALCTGSPEFYARLGWESWRGPLAIRTQQGLLETPGETVMIYRTPLTPPLDLDSLLTAEWREGELW